jgi:hypothetical protein
MWDVYSNEHNEIMKHVETNMPPVLTIPITVGPKMCGEPV